MPTDVSALTASILDGSVALCAEAADLMGRDIQLSAPIGETGDLSREWNASTQPSGSGAVSTLTFTTEYASFVDQGTRPHVIEGNPLLSFSWGGQQVIVHSVQHPGTAATNFFSDKAEDESLWAQQVQAALSGFVFI